MKDIKKGFTISEVLVVIVVIGIILAISIPSITAIRKRSNERLLDSKKDIILVAAKLYAKDKGLDGDNYVYVYELINTRYVDSEVKLNNENCKGEHSSNGCVLNPVDNSSLNEEKILIRLINDNYISIWDGETGVSGDKDLVDTVKDKLGCTDDMVNNMECVFCYNNSSCDNPDNYLYYSGIMWRVLGVYNINGEQVAKMVTDDTVVWEADV